jgi:nucleoside-diphosphate-sugar epimerase
MSLILLTGGLGFLGSRVIRSLAASGYNDIRCAVRPGTPANVFRSVLADFPQLRLDQFPVSFNDRRTLTGAMDGVGIVLHLAAGRRGSAAAMVANTVVGSDNLFQVSVNARVSRFVLVSSMGVMGMTRLSAGMLVDEDVPMDEHPERRDPYSFSKHRQEALAWKYADTKGLPLVVVRPGVIFGPGSEILHPRIGLNLFGLFLHLGRANRIPLIYVDNCADAVVLAGTTPGIEREIFCVVDDDLPTSHYLLRRYCREVKRLRTLSIPRSLLVPISKLNSWYSERTKGHLPVLFSVEEIATLWKQNLFSNGKAKKVLNWSPKISMRDSLDLTFSVLHSDQNRGSQG